MSFTIASINVNGLETDYCALIDYMIQKEIYFLACQETWMVPSKKLGKNHNLIVLQAFEPHDPTSGTRPTGGICIIRNPKLTLDSDFQLLETSPANDYLWFKFRKTLTIGTFYLRPQISQDLYMNAIQSADKYSTTTHHRNKVIMLGDFNTRLGELTGDNYDYPAWKRDSFKTLLNKKQFRLTVNPTQPQWTYVGTMMNGIIRRSIIDLILVSANIRRRCTDVALHLGPICDSPHRMVSIDINLPLPVSNPPMKWNLRRLKDTTLCEKFCEKFQKHLPQVLDKLNANNAELEIGTQVSANHAQEIVNRSWSAITTGINSAAAGTIRKTPAYRHTDDKFWDNELRELHNTKTTLQRTLENIWHNQHLQVEISQLLSQARKDFQRLYHKKKEERFFGWIESLHSMDNSASLKLLASIQQHHN
ncbi:hypothetical protein HK098_007376 [Nowakowskiella sp. JEL0407]|nr:hypothetical protein HK098_007376 [Nowakowskiella sp. JEL0407]